MLRVLSGLLVGIASAAFGLVPWLITGAHLPLQNLWATTVLDESAMPVVLLPFSQYAITLIVAVLMTGSAIAGFAARLLPGRRVGIVVGALVVQVAAVVQSAVVDDAGLQRTRFASLYLGLLVGVAVVAIVLGLLVLLLIALAPAPGLVVGVAIASVPFESWIAAGVVPFGSLSVPPLVVALLAPLRFVPAVAVGAAIAWMGLCTVGRVVAGLGALLIVWIGPAVVTGVVNAAGSRVYAHDPAAMLEAGRTVFVSALLSGDIAVPPLVLVLVVVLLGTVIRTIVRGRRRTVAPF